MSEELRDSESKAVNRFKLNLLIPLAFVAFFGVLVMLSPHAAYASSTVTVYVAAPEAHTTVSGDEVVIDTGVIDEPKHATPIITDYATGPSARILDIGQATPTIYGYIADWNTTDVANGHYRIYSTYESKKITAISPKVKVTVTGHNGISCTNTLDGSDVISLDHGAYHLQGDEWDSSQPFSLCNDGNADFTISVSDIDNTGAAPGAYPSLYKGCHWGDCTTDSGLPVQVSTMTSTPGTITTSYDTTTVSDTWDDSYDIWYNPATSTSDNQSGLELMIWLNHRGGVQPIGSVVASNVSIDGYTFDVWHGGSGTGTVSYVMTSPVSSVSDLDLGPIAADAVSRGYMTDSWYLIDVEAGFETWVGGQGLTANSFSVLVK